MAKEKDGKKKSDKTPPAKSAKEKKEAKKDKKQDDNKDYIQGFKDGTEYALKLSSNKAN